MNLYDEIGGDAAVAAVVSEFWQRVSTDELLSPWFSVIDSGQLRLHLHAYLTVALDGPERYEGRSMRHAHAGLRVTGEAFDLLVHSLGESLETVGAAPENIRRVSARLSQLRAVIVEVES
ncbi:group I truncated hemoglobin [Lacisediminihabitans sp. H27-G8]|uniref:group I truncated hemoglobin n=1 Tax=Lacisediminihabitans sp. H27-G8 TaxID=3111909 RepID=UPI0038FD05EA